MKKEMLTDVSISDEGDEKKMTNYIDETFIRTRYKRIYYMQFLLFAKVWILARLLSSLIWLEALLIQEAVSVKVCCRKTAVKD